MLILQSKEMLKSIAQINRKNQQNKNCSIEKINTIDRHLARLSKEEKKRKETQETCCQYEKLKKGPYC
jgi:hypothetical protein